MFDARSLEAKPPFGWCKDAAVTPMPERLRKVVELVLPDFQSPRPVKLQMAYASAAEESLLWVWELGNPAAAGFWIGESPETDTELVVRFADWLGEQVFPETNGAWGEARPECPGHRHPAQAAQHDQQAWWVCPATGRPIHMIGRRD